MPWFRIHGKPYLLSAKERQQQLCVQRERRGLLNTRRRDVDAGLSTRSRQSPGPSSTPQMYRPASHQGSQEGLSGSSSFYNPHHRMGFKQLRR
ncbi:hypothetical protein Goshw_015631 [Gossypium schwendimanii]|uniref:Uncharacterized protein n=1 Tax=Gossypium schwendimanii TaxID=34291 RepID=A0A7J9N3M6_GOSSC|nr:hypothetical protein [Gossypium schwendimanii]